MAGYPYVTQVDDTPTRKALISAFDRLTKAQTDLAALIARVDALQTPAPVTSTPGAVTTVTVGGGSGPAFGSYGPGDLIGVDSAATLVGIADVIAGNILASGGVNALPFWTKLQLATHVIGVLPVLNGGTGLSGYAVGDLLYASGAATLAKLADVATGNALISGGVGVAPSWGKIGLTTHVSGDLPFANLVQASAASKLVGRGSASGAGDFEEITLGTNLSLSGTTLNAAGGSGTGDVVGPASAVDTHVVAFDGTTGKLVKDSSTPTAPTPASSDNSTKVATTAFVATAVANAIAGVNPAVAVEAATAAVLQDTPTYANGVGGVGATLTAGSTNTTLVVDGYTPALNERLLVKNQASAFQNGVYVVAQLGAIGLAWILMRASDFNTPSSMNDTGAIPVLHGTANLDTSWVLTSHVTTIGTDALTFTQFSLNPTTIVTTARQVIAGTGLTGGGDLSADRTLAVSYGTSAGTAAQGNDARFAGATEQTTSVTGTQNDFDLSAAQTTLLVSNASAVVFTGFKVAGAAPAAGARVTIINTATSTVRVAYQDTGSTAAYRVISPSTRGQIVGAGGIISLVYDGTTSRWRVDGVECGAPIPVAFSAGNFTGGASNTWTVDAGDVLANTFVQEGVKVTWFLSIQTSTLGGTPYNSVYVALPNGFTVANNGVQGSSFGRYLDAATWLAMVAFAANTVSTVLILGSLGGANFASGTNTFHLQGMSAFLVD